MTFAGHIRAMRQRRGLTQRALADAAGLDYTYVSKIESGRLPHTPSARAIGGLARALEVDEVELLAVADKVPAALQPVIGSPEAVAFLRRASVHVREPEDWQRLSELLDRHSLEGATP